MDRSRSAKSRLEIGSSPAVEPQDWKTPWCVTEAVSVNGLGDLTRDERRGDGFAESVPTCVDLDGVLLAERKLPGPIKGGGPVRGVLGRLWTCNGDKVLFGESS